MIQSVPLIDYQVEAGTECQVSGWGATEWQGQMPEDLQVANVTIRDRNRCNWTYADIITDGMICANGLSRYGVEDVCQGGEGKFKGLGHSRKIKETLENGVKYRGWIL